MSDVTALLAQLAGPDRVEREAAAKALGAAGAREAVPALIQALSDKYTKVRTAAAMALAYIGHEHAIPPLIELTAQNPYRLRSAAGVALSTIGVPAVPYLIDALSDERNQVREQVVKALGRIGDRRAVPPLLPMLEERSLNVRYHTAQALEKLGDPRAIPALVRAVQRKDKSSHSAALALARIGGLDELAALLDDKRAWVRLSAVDGLRFAGEAGTPHLVQALEDPRAQVRARAAMELARRGDERALPCLREMYEHPDRFPGHSAHHILPYLEQFGAGPPKPPPPPDLSELWLDPVEMAPHEPAAGDGAQSAVAEFSLRSLLRDPLTMVWIDELLERDANVLLTPTWIAQAQKASSQTLLMETERDTLWPMASDLMQELWMALRDETAREWAGTALALLNELPGSGAVGERVRRVMADPSSTPRGHYEEGLQGYFRGLQFLLKSVFDLRLDPAWCVHRAHYVFPWSALPPIVQSLADHPALRQRWEDLHRFYTVFAGPSDCVCIAHLLSAQEVSPEAVTCLARDLEIPKINRKMGLGVQGLAERYTHHGLVFEALKETFLPDTSVLPLPRESVYAAVNMRSLLYGFEHLDGRMPALLPGRVDGLLSALAPLRKGKHSSFFDHFLMAQVELVADLPPPEVDALAPRVDPAMEAIAPAVRRRLNACAANLASLLEFVLLAAKLPVKPVSIGIEPPPQAKIYVEQVPAAFFERLHDAGQTVVDLCNEMRARYGPQKADGLRGHVFSRQVLPDDLRSIYNILSNMSASGKPIPKATKEWHTIAQLIERLARNPNVTADAYRHIHGGKEYCLQWCTAMAAFEAQMGDGTPVEGADLLFVEGWSDAIVPDHCGPLTNSAWRQALGKMTLQDLQGWSVAPI